MEYGQIRGLDRPLPRLIQGTLHLGHVEADAAWSVLDAAFERGLTAFDTAAVYAQGAVERLLGAWLEQRKVRDQVTLIDKGCHPLRGVKRMKPEELARDLSASLERLRVDHIELYLLHRDDPELPVDEIVSALNDAVSQGRIRAFGASNWSHQRLERAAAYAERHGLRGFAASSPGLSLALPVSSWPGCSSLMPDDATAYDWYRTRRMPVLAWSPLAGGFLTGRYTRENQAAFDAPSDRRVLEFYASAENFARLDRLQQMAAAKGLSTAQAALGYVLSQPLDVYAVLGCKNQAEIADAVASLGVRFSSQELGWLEGSS